MINGPINRAAFNVYVETQLAPTLARGDVVISIGFRSGEYCGRNRNQAPRLRSIALAGALLWTERVSRSLARPAFGEVSMAVA
jgi:class 3 adenylate cyclase